MNAKINISVRNRKLSCLISRAFILLMLLKVSLTSVNGQEQSDRISIFLDCQMSCDFSFIRQEITYIDYIRDRYTADIYIMATRQRTGSGGQEVSLVFTGNGRFSEMIDTVYYYVLPDATDVVKRRAMVKSLKKGLLPFLVQTSYADKITYKVKNGSIAEKPGNTIVNDPWDFWVFSFGGNASLDGESNFNNFEMRTRFSAYRVTEANKFYFTVRFNYEENNFTLSNGNEVTSIIERYSSYSRYVWSLDDHWSAGLEGSVGSSTFGNTDVEGYLRPAIEYNIYPYDLSNTKRFSFLYSIGPEYKDYTEVTVFDRLQETIFRQRLTIEFQQTQQWGDMSIDFRANQYLHNTNLYSISLNPEVEWNILNGLRLEFGGNVSYIADRINIARTEFTDEDILLGIKQLNTNYSYFSYVGINYRFGSRYNNVVNPRF